MKNISAVLIFVSTAAYAGEREELVAALMQGGSHQFEDERREVQVDGCQMTTFRWREIPNHGWVLWTSFQFDMIDAQLNEDNRFPGKKYAYGKLYDGTPEVGLALYGFTMRDGTLTRQERSVLREPSSDTSPSPRGDGNSHYYEWRDSMVISMTGPGVETKAITFTEAYDAYVSKYCSFSS